jgi:hypothetical protein
MVLVPIPTSEKLRFLLRFWFLWTVFGMAAYTLSDGILFSAMIFGGKSSRHVNFLMGTELGGRA